MWSAATITAVCTGIAGVLTAAVALVRSLQQAGVLKAHLASEAHASPPATDPSVPVPPP